MSINEEIAKEDQSMVIPKGNFVISCELDSDPPTCTVVSEDYSIKGKQIVIPLALAYFLRTHGCGSRNMRKLIEKQAKLELQHELQILLGLNSQQED